jgi:hypothetical protein
MDETTLGSCNGKGTSRCDYLWRRRSPLYAHGMGFIISGDVARYVADMARNVPLREHDVPSDVAYGMWLQPLEDLAYESVHSHFHTWPPVETGEPDVFHISLPITSSSAVVFPMTTRRWRRFDARTCTLSNKNEIFEAPTFELARIGGEQTSSDESSKGPEVRPSGTESQDKLATDQLATENTKLATLNQRLATENSRLDEERG